MNLKKINGIPIYGNTDFRGDCPPENSEQVTFFGWIRRQYPHTWGKIALHPRNEGQRTHAQSRYQKAEGMTTGASDIVIVGNPTFVCELKRKDHTKSAISKEQIEFLEASRNAGAFVCVALGWESAKKAFEDYILRNNL